MKGNGVKKSRLWRLVIPLSVIGLMWAVMLHAQGSGKYPGDVNVDKSIDVADSVLLARFIAEDTEALISEEGLINADADDDGGVTADDVVYIMQLIAKKIPMPTPPWETKVTEPAETTDTTTETTTTTTTVTTTETTAATTVTTTTETSAAETTETTATETEPVSAGLEFIADNVSYPLGDSVSVLTGQKDPNEMLTVNYKIGNITFAIFAENPAETNIAVAYQDNIVGYYKVCSEYTLPEGYTAREYRDSFQGEKLYAVLVLREDVSIDFMYLTEKNDMTVLSKLNYYAANAVRGINGLKPLMWDEELAKIALAHSVDMAENNYFDHTSPDGRTPQDRIEALYGDEWQSFAENVDAGYINPFDALNGWYNSEGHRNNLLKASLKRIGVGFAYCKTAQYRYFGTQDFVTLWDD